jgi:hypothetical protein
MTVLFRTQESLAIYEVQRIEIINGSSCIVDIGEKHISGTSIIQFITNDDRSYYSIISKNKDKKKAENLIRKLYEKDKADFSEYVFIPYGFYEVEDDKYFMLRFNKENGYKEVKK